MYVRIYERIHVYILCLYIYTLIHTYALNLDEITEIYFDRNEKEGNSQSKDFLLLIFFSFFVYNISDNKGNLYWTNCNFGSQSIDRVISWILNYKKEQVGSHSFKIDESLD